VCGIAGAYGALDFEASRELVAGLVIDQRQRGPDYQQVMQYGVRGRGAVFGHDRLSILDPSPAGHQPMRSNDGRYHITYNGEIYNYIELRLELEAFGTTFRTGTDTEVLIAALARWGKDALVRLNGMFAFALYDSEQHRLLLVRDRFGVKPLYYVLEGDRVVFASTGREIARRLRLGPNLTYVARGLRYLVYEDESDIAPYEKLRAVPAGHWVEFSSLPDGAVVSDSGRWYDLEARVLPLREELASCPYTVLGERFEQTLEDAVTIRLRSDVPVAISISGGLDSSSIAAIASTRQPRLAGFCYGLPEIAGSEGQPVASMAARNGLDVHYTWLPTNDERRQAFWDTLQAQDAPFPNLSMVAQYAIFKAVRAGGYKVALGGQGGDEALMGYHKFRLLQLQAFRRSGDYLSVLQAAVGLLRVVVASWEQVPALWQHRARYAGKGGLPIRLCLPETQAFDLRGDPLKQLWHRQLLDIVRFSLPTLLRYEDRNSMGNSVESRLPFVDYRIIELGVAMPDAAKLRLGRGKWILRSIMKGKLPERIRMNWAKRGFDINGQAWIQAGLGKAIREKLADARRSISEFLPERTRIEDLFSDDSLLGSGNAFAEAVSLLWLGAVS